MTECENEHLSKKVKYKHVKTNIYKLFLNDDVKDVVNDAVCKTSTIIYNMYHFLKLYFLHCYNENMVFPFINTMFLRNIVSIITITEKHRGGSKANETNLLKDLKDFYEKNNISAIIPPIINNHLAIPIVYELDIALTNIENNIKMHFEKRFIRFIKTLTDYFENIKKFKKEKDKLNKFKQYYNSVFCYFKSNMDALELTKKETKEFFDIDTIIEYKELIFNEKKTDDDYNILYDIYENPQKYIETMFLMNYYFKSKGLHTFTILPERTKNIPKNITIDTKFLILKFWEDDEIPKEKCNKEFASNKKLQNEIWGKFLDMKKFKKVLNGIKFKGYEFNYMIQTDGYSCSIRLSTGENKKWAKKDIVIKIEEDKTVKKTRSEILKMTKEEKEQYKEDLRISKEKNKEAKKIAKEKQREEKKIAYEKLKEEMKIEKKKLREESKKNNKDDKKKTKEKTEKYYFLDKLNKNELNKISKDKIITIDPGINDIMYSGSYKEEELITYRYSNKDRKQHLKTECFNNILKKVYRKYGNKRAFEKNNDILSKYDINTLSFKNYLDNLKIRNKIDELEQDYNENIIHKKIKFRRHICMQKENERMINELLKKHNVNKNNINETSIVIGNFILSDKTIKGKNKIVKEKILDILHKRKIKVFIIDEYNTSKLCCKCEEELIKDFEKLDKNNEKYISHGILRCQSSNHVKNDSKVYHNRDKNAVMNMQKIVKHIFENDKRPKKYCSPYN
jgi:hypothetical protein